MSTTIPKQRVATSDRVLSFAPDRSVGTLFVRPTGGDPDAGGWEPLAAARWSVLVPERMDVRLWVDPPNARRSISVLRHLPADSLSEVVLMSSPVTDNHLRHLVGLSALRLLDLFHTKVTDPGLEHVASLTSLEWLSFTGTNVGDSGVVRLATLPALRRLSLKDTRITDASAAILSRLPNLHWLSVSGTRITDAGLRLLASSPSLRALSVHRCNVTRAQLDATTTGHPNLALIEH